MKKFIVLTISIVILIAGGVLSFIYRDYLFCCPSITNAIELDESTNTQSIMTFNVKCITKEDREELRWINRAPLVCEILQEYEPSIICLQENKSRQYDFFKKHLKGYASVATQRDSTALSECLPVFYRKDMYEATESKTFWLSDTPEKMSNTWDSAYNRICTYIILKNKKTQKKFIVANTHLDYKSEETRKKSIELIHEKLRSFNLPALLTGDFNDKPSSQTLKLAMRYFSDCGKNFEDEKTGTINRFKDDRPNVKIDYILQTPDAFEIKRYEVIDKKYSEKFASDHFPIYAEFS